MARGTAKNVHRNSTRLSKDKGMFRSGTQHHYHFSVPNQTEYESWLIRKGIY